MKAIKLAALVLAAFLVSVTQVTAYELSINFENRTLGFYAMPTETVPQDAMDVLCSSGWSWELYRWKQQEAGHFVSVLEDKGECAESEISPPRNPADKFGI